MMPTGVRAMWIGGFRSPGGRKPWNGMWRWKDGSRFSYAKWHRPEQPNNLGTGKEYNIEMLSGGEWNDIDAKHAAPFMCKCR